MSLPELHDDWEYAYSKRGDKFHTIECQSVKATDTLFEFTDDPAELGDREHCGHCANAGGVPPEQPVDESPSDEPEYLSFMEAGETPVTAALEERVAEMDDDPSLQYDSRERHADGWIKQYVECPDCEVPMARTTVFGNNQRVDDEGRIIEPNPAVDVSNSEHVCVCPNCKMMSAVVEVTVRKAPFGELQG